MWMVRQSLSFQWRIRVAVTERFCLLIVHRRLKCPTFEAYIRHGPSSLLRALQFCDVYSGAACQIYQAYAIVRSWIWAVVGGRVCHVSF